MSLVSPVSHNSLIWLVSVLFSFLLHCLMAESSPTMIVLMSYESSLSQGQSNAAKTYIAINCYKNSAVHQEKSLVRNKALPNLAFW